MDKLEWLKNIVKNSPQDPQGWYWLAQEHGARGNYGEALAALAEGMKVCDEGMTPLLVGELARISAQMGAGVQPAAAIEPEQQESAVETKTETKDGGESSSPRVISLFSALANSSEEPSKRPNLEVLSGGAPVDDRTEVSGITFQDVGGLTDLKKTIRMKIIDPFHNKGIFAKFKKKAGGGVLLYGPPGCGKTFIARATAGEVGARFMNVQITDVLDPYTGRSEQNLLKLFDKARHHSPCVMFFDELDAIGFNRAKVSSYSRPLVDLLLSEMEGVDKSTEGLLVMGATNMPWDVDDALKRPGRFERMIFVAPPDEEARALIFQLKLQGRPVGFVDYGGLARATEFYSGADIENVVERAAENVLERIMETGNENQVIEMADLMEAVGRSVPSTLEWLRTVKNYVKYANQSGLYNDVEEYLRKYGKRL